MAFGSSAQKGCYSALSTAATHGQRSVQLFRKNGERGYFTTILPESALYRITHKNVNLTMTAVFFPEVLCRR